jgi:hypothetical protein
MVIGHEEEASCITIRMSMGYGRWSPCQRLEWL